MYTHTHLMPDFKTEKNPFGSGSYSKAKKKKKVLLFIGCLQCAKHDTWIFSFAPRDNTVRWVLISLCPFYREGS